MRKRAEAVIAMLLDLFPRLSRILAFRRMSSPSIDLLHKRRIVSITSHLPADSQSISLPLNVTSKSDLIKTDWHGRSFFGVPDRVVGSSLVVRVESVLVLWDKDEWGNHFYSVMLPSLRLLPIKGTCFRKEHSRQLIRSKRNDFYARASWFLDLWCGNHFHWMATMLPKAMVLIQLHPDIPLLVPGNNVLTPAMRRSLELVGIDRSKLLTRQSNVLLNVHSEPTDG